MAYNFCSSSILKWSFLITCICLHTARNLAQFPRIEHASTKNGGSVSFLVVGDWGRGGNFNQSKVATQMGEIGNKLGIDFVISTGDNFYYTGLKGVNDPIFKKSFTNIYTATSLQIPCTGAQLSPALRKIDNRWHCMRNFIVETGILDIVFIDTTPFVDMYFENPKNQRFDWKDVLPRGKYMSYLSKNLDLALKKSEAPWKIVVGHHTMKSIGSHGDTEEIVTHLLPILEENKVKMYINGHDHCLEHLSNQDGGGGSKAWKNNIHYKNHNDSTHFYYDGQGFMYVEITYEKAKIAFYDVSGKPIYKINTMVNFTESRVYTTTHSIHIHMYVWDYV
ncbi:hypothetical protein ABFS83_07G072400 [Erythranthe nasuta]